MAFLEIASAFRTASASTSLPCSEYLRHFVSTRSFLVAYPCFQKLSYVVEVSPNTRVFIAINFRVDSQRLSHQWFCLAELPLGHGKPFHFFGSTPALPGPSTTELYSMIIQKYGHIG